MTVTAAFGLRAAFYEQLHCRYQRHQFDNWQVWGGNVTIAIDGRVCEPPLARAYIEPGKTTAIAQVRCELFVAAVDPDQVQPRDVDARLWTDASGTSSYVEMRLLVNAEGTPVLADNNLVFESVAFALERTGAFNYAVEFSADSYAEAGRKEWISLNDLAENRDGIIVVSPEWVRRGTDDRRSMRPQGRCRGRGGPLSLGSAGRTDAALRRHSSRCHLPVALLPSGFCRPAHRRGRAQGHPRQRLCGTGLFPS